MRNYPSRSPEARRAEYLRNKGARQQRQQASKDELIYARKVVAQETGLPSRDIPELVAIAKLEHLRVIRKIRARQAAELPSLLCREYKEGRTTYELAEKFKVDRDRVSSILKANGIKLKRRDACKYGHPYTPENAYIKSNGSPACRACNREGARRYEERRRKEREGALFCMGEGE